MTGRSEQYCFVLQVVFCFVSFPRGLRKCRLNVIGAFDDSRASHYPQCLTPIQVDRKTGRWATWVFRKSCKDVGRAVPNNSHQSLSARARLE